MSDANERNSFIGKSVPVEVKQLAKYLKTAKVEVFTEIVEVACAMLSSPKQDHETFSALTKQIDGDVLTSMYPGILTILQRGIRQSKNLLKKKDLNFDLTALNIPEKFRASLTKAILGDKRLKMEETALANRPTLPALDEFRWRVDVAISTTALKRSLEPSILCNIQTDHKQDCTFEVSKEKFHELRYAVAEVLDHMQQLEKRSVMKIET